MKINSIFFPIDYLLLVSKIFVDKCTRMKYPVTLRMERFRSQLKLSNKTILELSIEFEE